MLYEADPGVEKTSEGRNEPATFPVSESLQSTPESSSLLPGTNRDPLFPDYVVHVAGVSLWLAV